MTAMHAGDRQRRAGVDVQDFGVGVGAADDVHVQHPRQLHVIEIMPFALNETRVFLALHAMSHTADFGGVVTRISSLVSDEPVYAPSRVRRVMLDAIRELTSASSGRSSVMLPPPA